MINIKAKKERSQRRHQRVRGKISGTAERPRLCVFCSNKHVYAQLIDDETGKVLAAAKDSDIKTKSSKAKKEKKEGEVALGGKKALSFEVGKLIAEKAAGKKIKKVVFDRGSRLYHGRVKALAEGAREGGLEF